MTATMRLYEWGEELARVEDMLHEAEGELTPEIEQALEDVTLGFSEKAERVGLYIRNLVQSAKGARAERDRLDAIARHHEKAADSLKRYLQVQMELAGIPKIESVICPIRLQKSPPSVVAPAFSSDDLREIRSEYVVYIPESLRLNNTAIIQHWKQTGKSPIEGVSVVQNLHLRVG